MALLTFGAQGADMFDSAWGFGALFDDEPVPVAASPLQVELLFPGAGVRLQLRGAFDFEDEARLAASPVHRVTVFDRFSEVLLDWQGLATTFLGLLANDVATLAAAQMQGPDLVRGGSGDDALRGYRGDDLLDGGAGDDRLAGDEGNDTLIGGDGNDVARFGYAASAATIGGDGAGFVWTVAGDIGAAAAGTDTLVGIERLQFADRALGVEMPPLAVPAGGPLRLAATPREARPSLAAITLDDGSVAIAWHTLSTVSSADGEVYLMLADADLAPLGPAVRVNTETFFPQYAPALAQLAGGDLVVAWTSTVQDEYGGGIQAQRFGADGVPIDAEFRVNEIGDGNQELPAIAALASGGFVVAWQADGDPRHPDGFAAFARLFDAAGNAGVELALGSTREWRAQTAPDLLALPDSGFVAVWAERQMDPFGPTVWAWSIVGRRFSADGVALGDEFVVAASTEGSLADPSVATLAGGGFVVVWEDRESTGQYQSIAARRYDAAAVPAGPAQTLAEPPPVPGFTARLEYAAPSVVGLADGGFVATWSASWFGQESELLAMRFDAFGNALGRGPFAANADPAGYRADAAAIASSDGGFAVLWQGSGDAGGSVDAQRFSPDLTPLLFPSIVGTDDADQIRAGAGRQRLEGRAGDETLAGGDGDDRFDGGPGNDRFDGGDGVDEALYPGSHAGYAWSRDGTAVVVDASAQGLGVDTMVSVERLWFDDLRIALDLDGNAGATARLIAAAFGPTYLEPALTGVGIRVFDAGWSMLQVAQAALATDLFLQVAGSRSDEAVVRALYQNVVGAAPSQPEVDAFVELLQSGMSQAELLVFAAEHPLAAARIDLAGLAETGLPYL